MNMIAQLGRLAAQQTMKSAYDNPKIPITGGRTQPTDQFGLPSERIDLPLPVQTSRRVDLTPAHGKKRTLPDGSVEGGLPESYQANQDPLKGFWEDQPGQHPTPYGKSSDPRFDRSTLSPSPKGWRFADAVPSLEDTLGSARAGQPSGPNLSLGR